MSGENSVEVDMTCTICLESIGLETRREQKAKVALLVQCGHFYNKTCLDNWLRSQEKGKGSCPTCRTGVQSDMEVKVMTAVELSKDMKSILKLRERHMQRRALERLTLDMDSNGMESEEEDLRDVEWVHISLHPMEHSDPIAIQRTNSNGNLQDRDRADSPFTIITQDEIQRSQTPPQPNLHTEEIEERNLLSWIDNNMMLNLPSPYYSPYYTIYATDI